MNPIQFSESPDQRTLTVRRSFDAPVAKVWSAWTERELLEKWWAPLPWKAVTKTFDFSEGGRWHYYMEGPEGEQHWCRVDYLSIEPKKRFTARDSFCDENAVPNAEMPSTSWDNAFADVGGRTDVVITLSFVSPEDLKRIVEMGFKEGFTMGLDQLENLLASGKVTAS